MNPLRTGFCFLLAGLFASMAFAADRPNKEAFAKAGDAKATKVVLHVNLPAGVTQLQAWFQDAAGKDLCGAYYADVSFVGESK